MYATPEQQLSESLHGFTISLFPLSGEQHALGKDLSLTLKETWSTAGANLQRPYNVNFVIVFLGCYHHTTKLPNKYIYFICYLHFSLKYRLNESRNFGLFCHYCITSVEYTVGTP